jgi:hypothetical protein
VAKVLNVHQLHLHLTDIVLCGLALNISCHLKISGEKSQVRLVAMTVLTRNSRKCFTHKHLHYLSHINVNTRFLIC